MPPTPCSTKDISIMNTNQHKKKPYLPPTIELYEYAVEHGFADTNPNIITPMMYNNEVITEITDETGQNYHGEWY